MRAQQRGKIGAAAKSLGSTYIHTKRDVRKGVLMMRFTLYICMYVHTYTPRPLHRHSCSSLLHHLHFLFLLHPCFVRKLAKSKTRTITQHTNSACTNHRHVRRLPPYSIESASLANMKGRKSTVKWQWKQNLRGLQRCVCSCLENVTKEAHYLGSSVVIATVGSS